MSRAGFLADAAGATASTTRTVDRRRSPRRMGTPFREARTLGVRAGGDSGSAVGRVSLATPKRVKGFHSHRARMTFFGSGVCRSSPPPRRRERRHPAPCGRILDELRETSLTGLFPLCARHPEGGGRPVRRRLVLPVRPRLPTRAEPALGGRLERREVPLLVA